MKNKKAYYGEFGGQFVPEVLMPILENLDNFYKTESKHKEFKKELSYYLKELGGRPTPLYYAKNLTEHLGGARIYLKREDLAHLGAHKIKRAEISGWIAAGYYFGFMVLSAALLYIFAETVILIFNNHQP